MPTHRCDGAILNYDQTGQGPDIVWMPGGDNVGTDWRYQTAAFDGEFRCTTHDPRGAGATEALVPPPWSITQLNSGRYALTEPFWLILQAMCSAAIVACIRAR